MKSQSTRKSRRRKSAKPVDRPPKPDVPDFPLCPANNGHWQKKIRGRIHYFGRWGRVVNGVMTRIQEDGCWQAALEEYKKEADRLHAGLPTRDKKAEGDLTVRDICNSFLRRKLKRVECGEITAGTFAEYRATTDRLIAIFGKERRIDDLTDDDFEDLRAGIAKQWGPVRLANEVVRVKSVFKHAKRKDLVPDDFRKPSAGVLRRHRAENGDRMMEPADLRKLIAAAPVQLKGMLLLGINCGFTNKDVGDLPLAALDLDGGWIIFPRPKTGIERRIPIWPETVEALRAVIAKRPMPKDRGSRDLVFLMKRGECWVRNGSANLISHAVRRLMKDTGVHRERLGLATLRHVLQTIGDESADFIAVRKIMGHTFGGDISEVYRERVSDARLVAVTDHVRKWLFGDTV